MYSPVSLTSIKLYFILDYFNSFGKVRLAGGWFSFSLLFYCFAIIGIRQNIEFSVELSKMSTTQNHFTVGVCTVESTSVFARGK